MNRTIHYCCNPLCKQYVVLMFLVISYKSKDLTPKSIVEFLMDQEELKTDFSKPHKLCANQYKFERKGQEESLYKAYNFILDQYCDFHLDLTNSFDKLYFPLLAIQSAPGGGKSFFLDELASLTEMFV
jgi:hypothetical protein